MKPTLEVFHESYRIRIFDKSAWMQKRSVNVYFLIKGKMRCVHHSLSLLGKYEALDEVKKDITTNPEKWKLKIAQTALKPLRV